MRHAIQRILETSPRRGRFGWATRLLLWIGCLSVVTSATAAETVPDEFGKRATWQVPAAATVRDQVLAWAKQRSLDEAGTLKVETLWPEPAENEAREVASTELLERVVTTIAAIDDDAARLVEQCRSIKPPLVMPEHEMLVDDTRPEFERQNLRLYYGRWLAQNRLIDESLKQLDGLKPEGVVDPATLLFYQSVCHHRLLDKEKCLPALAQLMENDKVIPRRYATVAKLMEADLKPLKTDSLDEVSRLMDDIQRRLDLARAGKKVRKQEDDVIAKLDKMIEELEKQQQQQQGGGGSAGGMNPSSPMQDSQAGGGTGPGDVDQKRTGSKSGWGNLPQKDRQEALQRISKDLPAHYREVIEEYFRKLANDGS